MLRVTLKKSAIKATEPQQDTIRGLGLRKLNSSSVVKDTPEVQGMIDKVRHLLEVEEVEE